MSTGPTAENIEPDDPHHDPTTPQALATIQEALSGLRYGHVTVIVHNGVVVQVERLEKKRLRSE